MTGLYRPPMLAYLHLRPATPRATSELLREYIDGYADREGFVLEEVLIGTEGHTEPTTVRTLVARVHATGARTVLVAGPGRQAMVALHRLSGVRVLTLADVGLRGR